MNEEKDFLIIWHYMANYGVVKIKALNRLDAYDKFWYKRKEVEAFVVELDKVATFNEKEDTLKELRR